MPLTRTGLIRPSIPSAEDMDITSEPRHSIVRPVEHDHSLPRRGLIRPFVPSFEEMDCTSEPQHSIVRPVEPNHSLSSHFEPSNHNYVVNKVCLVILLPAGFFRSLTFCNFEENGGGILFLMH
jgi:hypothetical protein